ncbi:efflux RND transporter periplasmic adaptor subunit [Hydrocarboniphaga sp.]|uniref:efflux RND transporter periplasmic adaptor subunit n=1 Tax=Hydrocarboniphaga sp. TaxID=2033016 RepID=UPI0026031680|nr:efflux RND transporter periplasmic adaptor subunit [Hydrocarboniphaga sp.]
MLLIAGMAGLGYYFKHREPAAQAGGFGAGAGGPPGAPGGGGGRRGATTVGTTVAESTDMPVILEALGTVTPAATVTVRPQVSGVITEVRFREGQLVNKGEVLAVIDRRPFQMSLMQAQAQQQRDQAELENAKLTLERYRMLQTQDSIAQQDVDTQAATVKQLEGTVASDRAAVGTAQLDLDYSEIRSPIAGRTGLRVIDAGNYIAAGDTNGIVVVTQISPTDVEFTVPQDRVSEIIEPVSKGQALAITALDRTRTHTLSSGVFSTLDNQVNIDTGTVRAKARFENKDGALFPSQFVNVRLTLRLIDNAVTLPVSAVRNGADGDFVWLLKDDQTATMRKVTRGQATNDRVQVTDGVKVGEVVITEGGDRLQEGGHVILPADAAKAPAAGAADATNADGQKKREHRRRKDGAPGDKPAAPGTP